jgi:hypothetical protein
MIAMSKTLPVERTEVVPQDKEAFLFGLLKLLVADGGSRDIEFISELLKRWTSVTMSHTMLAGKLRILMGRGLVKSELVKVSIVKITHYFVTARGRAAVRSGTFDSFTQRRIEI